MKRITICITTHCVKTESQKQFFGNTITASNSMPSTLMVENVLKNIFEFTDLNKDNCYINIGFDKRKNRKIDEEYEVNLLNLIKQYDGKLIINESEISDPLKTAPINFINLIKSVETEVYLLWEHDWIFTRKVNLLPIVDEIESNTKINWVKLNAKNNNNEIWEHILPYTTPSTNIPLLATHKYSNNPHLCRTETFNKWWAKLVYITGDDTAEHWGVPGFVEGPLALFYEFTASKIGWERAVEMWGCYIYGKFNDEAYVRHLESNER